MAEMEKIPHIKDLKYKGFHPLDKKKVIKEINSLIDDMNKWCLESLKSKKYSEDFEDCGNRLDDKVLILARNGVKDFEQKAKEKFPSSEGLLMKYIQELRRELIMHLKEEYFKLQKEKYKIFIEKITTSNKNSLKDIEREIINYRKEIAESYLKYLKEKWDGIDQIISNDVSAKISKVKLYYREYMNEKLKKLFEKINVWISIIESKMGKDKDSKFKSSFEELKNAIRSKLNLDNKNADILKDFLKPHLRYWYAISQDVKSKYLPIPTANTKTNEIITNFIYAITESTAERNIDNWVKNYARVDKLSGAPEESFEKKSKKIIKEILDPLEIHVKRIFRIDTTRYQSIGKIKKYIDDAKKALSNYTKSKIDKETFKFFYSIEIDTQKDLANKFPSDIERLIFKYAVGLMNKQNSILKQLEKKAEEMFFKNIEEYFHNGLFKEQVEGAIRALTEEVTKGKGNITPEDYKLYAQENPKIHEYVNAYVNLRDVVENKGKLTSADKNVLNTILKELSKQVPCTCFGDPVSDALFKDKETEKIIIGFMNYFLQKQN